MPCNVVELSYVSCHLFFSHLLSATFTVHQFCTLFTLTLIIVFLCKGISDSAAMREAKKKREKSLQLRMLVGKTRYRVIKGVASADGDGKCWSGVDDPARNEPPSQVLALTSRCHMWLHVGVYLVFERPKSVFIKIRKDIFYMNHHHGSTRSQIASQGTG